MYRNEVVSLEHSTEKAFEGKYFAGHTPALLLHGLNAYGALVNPPGSGVNMFINTYSLSNYSNMLLQTYTWMNCPLGRCLVSSFVSTSNFAKRPLTVPKAEVVYRQDMSGEPSGGVNLFPWIAAANQTTVGTFHGRYIIPPGGSFLVFLCAPEIEAGAEIAFGWWEDKTIKSC